MNRKIYVSFVALLAGFIIFYSCTKIDTTDLGNDLIPAVDNVTTFDTVFDVISDNRELNDSLVTYGRPPVAIGVIADDPEFGKTESSLYFSMSPGTFGSYPFLNKDSIKSIDSVVLQLDYSSLYGDSLSNEKFEVFQIDPASPFTDSNYKVNETPFAILPALLGSKSVDFQKLNDSLTYVNGHDTVKTINQLRISLDTTFGRMFINYDTAVQYKTDSAFRTFFKGLAIKINEGASTAKNGVAYFDITSANTQLIFYLRAQTGGKIDTITRTFSYSNYQANLIRRTPAHGYQTYLNNGIGNNDDLIYLQSSPGSYAEIKIPGLENLSNRVIHRAELIMEQVPSALDNIYTPPGLLFIDGINNTGDSTFTLRGDFQYTGTGVGYDVGTIRGDFVTNKYVFNLSRYVQSIVTRKLPSRTLRVYAPYRTDPYFEAPTGGTSILPTILFINSPIASGRAVLGGGSNTTKKMRLRIIYSKI